MLLDEFDYDLPPDRIAQTPVEPRDAARLLVDRGRGAAEHRVVGDLPELLGDGDVLVVNTTRVIPARLKLARRSGGAVEVLLLEPVDAERRRWEALMRPARKVRDGEVLTNPNGDDVLVARGRSDGGDTVIVELIGSVDPLTVIDANGEMPLPPYIAERLADPDRYQTVYADQPGAAAAPTAGLHFTPELLGAVAAVGVDVVNVELVVGLDTFRPVTVNDPRHHTMHSERYRVSADAIARCRDARRVVAVGTTSVRAVESAAATGVLDGRTSIFIHRPYQWQLVDLMLTNFHLPRTTLLMMIDAFVGPRWRRLYDEALASGYRFLSFGDAMLLDRRAS